MDLRDMKKYDGFSNQQIKGMKGADLPFWPRFIFKNQQPDREVILWQKNKDKLAIDCTNWRVWVKDPEDGKSFCIRLRDYLNWEE